MAEFDTKHVAQLMEATPPEESLEPVVDDSSFAPSPPVGGETLVGDQWVPQQDLRATLLASSKENPDQYAETLGLSKKTGVPTDVIKDRVQDFKSSGEFTPEFIKTLSNENGSLYEWLQKPENARIAHDDVSSLAEFGKSVKNVPSALMKGQTNVMIGQLRFKEMRGKATPEELKYIEEYHRLNKIRDENSPKVEGLFTGIPSTVAEMIPQLAETAKQSLIGGLVAGLATGGVATPFGLGAGAFKANAEVEAGLAYDEFVSIRGEDGERLDPKMARMSAMFVGISNGAMETISLGKLSKTIPGLEKVKKYFTRDGVAQLLKTQAGREAIGKVAKKYGESIVTETLTETLQEAVTMYVGELQKITQDGSFEVTPFADQVDRLGGAAKAGFQASVGLGFSGTAVRTGQIIAESKEVPDPSEVAQYLRDTASRVTNSKLYQRSPEKFHDQAKAQTEGKEFYVNSEKGVELYQSLPPEVQEQLNEAMPDLYRELQEGAVTGKDIPVSQADYFTYIAPNDESGLLSDYTKLNADQFSIGEINEVYEANEEIREVMDELREEYASEQADYQKVLNDAEQLESRLVAQLQNSGKRFTQSAYRAMASVHKSLYETQIERYGPSAQRALEKLYGDLRVEGPAQSAKITPRRTLEDGYIDNVRNESIKRRKRDEKSQEKRSKNKDMFGKSSTKTREKVTPTPLISMLSKLGGIARGTPIAKELASMGITPKSYSRLFKKDGSVRGLDNLVISEVEDALGVTGIFPDDGTGYVNQDQLLELLRDETFGKYIRNEDQILADELSDQMDQTLSELSRQGIDVESATNKEIRKALEIASKAEERIDIQEPDFFQDGNINTDSEAFKNWFGDSKVVDENGDPLVVYHGTSTDFTVFDKDKVGYNYRESEGGGFFFTQKKRSAENYAYLSSGGKEGNVVNVYIKIENPLIIKTDSDNNAPADVYDMRSARLGDDARLDGHDGIIIKGTKEDDLVVAFEPSQIKSVNNRGTFDPDDPRILYQDDAKDRDLVVRHNISERGIMHALKIGGIPVPSLAIGKTTEPFEGFGEITLIADKSLIDPRASKKSKVFGADIYSPRYPSIDYVVNHKEYNEVVGELEEQIEGSQLDGLVNLQEKIEDDGIEAIITNRAVQYAYLKKQGKDPRITYKKHKKGIVDTHKVFKKYVGTGQDYFDLRSDQGFKDDVLDYIKDTYGDRADLFMEEDGQPNSNIVLGYAREVYAYKPKTNKQVDRVALEQKIAKKIGNDTGFEQWVKDNFYYVIKDERIFDGYTPSGNRKYLPHNLQTVVRVLSRNLQDGEGFNYGLPNVRSKFAKKFKSVGDIKANKDLIVSNKDFEKVKEEVGEEFDNVMDALRPYSAYGKEFGFGDIFSEHMKEIADRGNVKKVIDEYYGDVPDDVVKSVGDFLSKLEHMPTEYFEAKIQRAVDISEFSGALVPKGKGYSKVTDALKNKGIKVTRYDSKKDGDRQEQLQKQSKLFFQDGDDTKRGSISFEDKGDVVIRLTEASDLSTFLHESGHLWLEYWRDFSAQEDAPLEAQEDWKALRDWMGLKDGQKIETEHHEKFARGIENYFMTGKAPSKPLLSAFRQFTSWLMKLYKDAKNLNADLTPEITEVFDRMFATSEEINDVVDADGFNADPQILALLTKAEKEKYLKISRENMEVAKERLLRDALKQHTRKETKWFKEERERVVNDARDEIQENRLYKALNFVLNGTDFDGNSIDNGQSHKMNKKKFIDLYGAENAKAMPKGTLLSGKEGVHPEIVAELFDFSNGSEMVEAMMNALPIKDQINEMADNTMIERHGDMLNDGTIEELARDAVNDDLRATTIGYELEQLSLKAGDPVISKDDIKQLAKEILAERPVGKIRPYDYYRSELKNSRIVGKHLATKSYDKAAEAKRKQLLNHYLFREAREAQKDIEKTLKKWTIYNDSDKKWAKRKSMDIDYVYAIRNILAQHGIGKGDKHDFGEWFAQLEVEDPEASQTLATLIDLNTGGARNYKNLNYEAFLGLKNAIQGISDIGRDVIDIELDGKKFKTKDIVSKIVESIKDNNKGRDRSKRYQDITGNNKKFWGQYDKEVTRMEFILKAMDGGETNGLLNRVFLNPLAKAGHDNFKKNRVFADKITAILGENDGSKNRWNKKITDPRFGEDKFTVKSIITIALNMGNEGNLQKLLDGNDWSYNDVRGLVEDHLTEKDMDTVQSIWNLMEELRPDLQRVHKEVSGFPMEVVKAIPLEIMGNTYAGGYFPVVYDSDRSVIGQRNSESISVFENNFSIPTVGKGMSKSRTNFSAPIDLEFENVVANHFRKTIQLITHGKIVKDLSRVIQQKEFQQAIIDYSSADTYAQFKPWLQALAGDTVYDTPIGGVEKIIRHLRTATTGIFMGFGVSTMAKQTLGMTTTMAAVTRGELSKKNFLKGMRQYATHPAESAKFAMENSFEMASRVSYLNADVAQVMESANRAKNWRGKIQYAGMAGIGYSQLYSVDIPTWFAGYEEGMERFESKDRAIEFADALVRQTQGSGHIKDLAKIQRGGEWQRAGATMFGTFILGVLYPRLRELGLDAREGKASKAAISLVPLILLPAILEGFMSGDAPDDDETFVEWMLLKSMLYGFSSLPIASNMMEATFGDYDYTMSPIESPVNMFIHKIKSDDQEKWIEGLVIGTGLAFKLPTYKPYKIIDELRDQASGEEDFNILELVGAIPDADR